MAEEDSIAASGTSFRFRDTVRIKLGPPDTTGAAGTPAQAAVKGKRRSLVARASDQEWAASALLLLLDVASWFLVYGFTGFVRGDSYILHH